MRLEEQLCHTLSGILRSHLSEALLVNDLCFEPFLGRLTHSSQLGQQGGYIEVSWEHSAMLARIPRLAV